MRRRRKKLILHIGMHKTGTSSVQRYFSRNRWVLRRLGIAYPLSIGPDGARQPKHNAIFAAISHEADFGAPHPALGPAAALIAATADEIDAAPGRVGLLSAEGLSGERPVFAAAMAALADRFEVEVIAFLRRPDLWVEAFYKQMVQNRDTREARSFAAFLAAPETEAHLDFAAILDWWAAAFGADQVRAYPFDPGRRGSAPLPILLRHLGAVRVARRLPFRRAHENPSPGVDATELLRRCNAAGVDAPARAAAMIEARLGPSPKGFLSPDARIALLNRLSPSIRTLDRYAIDGAESPFFQPFMREGREHEWRAEFGHLDAILPQFHPGGSLKI